MMKLGRTRVISIAPLVLASLLTSACAISTPATITSAQNSPQAITSVQLLRDAEEKGVADNLRSRFRDELTQQLRARGVNLGTGAEYVMDFAVSQRDAEVGLQPVSVADAGDTAEPIEPSIRGRWYHKCKPTRVSASIVIYARANGAAQANSSGEFLACPDDLSQLGDLAKILVERTVSN